MLGLPQLAPLPRTRAAAEAFAAFQESCAGFHTPVEILEKSAVHVARDRAGRFCGGLVIGTETPFRALEATVCDADRPRVASLISPTDTVELHGVMLRPEWRGGLRSTWFWLEAVRVVRATGKKTLLGSTTEPKLARLYEKAGGTVIYRGEILWRGVLRPTVVLTWPVDRLMVSFLRGALSRAL